jgi:hypothetical protein
MKIGTDLEWNDIGISEGTIPESCDLCGSYRHTLFLCLIKHHYIEAYERGEVNLQAFLTLVLKGDE